MSYQEQENTDCHLYPTNDIRSWEIILSQSVFTNIKY